MTAFRAAQNFNPLRRVGRLRVIATALTLVSGLLAVIVTQSPAAAADTPSTILVHYSHGATTWTVPAGVYAVDVQAVGGSGGEGLGYVGQPAPAGGFGGNVEERIRVTPGQVLDIHPGQQGKDADGNISVPAAKGGAGFDGRTGGFGGLGTNDLFITRQSGGGGGGASEVLLDGQPVVVAAGGGGAGGDGSGLVSDLAGGRGGDAGHWGSNGHSSAAGGAGVWDQSYGRNANSAQILFASGGGGGGGGGWLGGSGGDAAYDGGGGGGGAGGSNWASQSSASLGDVSAPGDGWVQIRPMPYLTPSISLGASTSAVLYFNPVTLTVVVRPDASVPNAPQPTGTVSLQFETGLSVTLDLVNGAASLSSSLFTMGPHSAVARYSGDSAYLPGQSPQTVNFTVLQGDNSDLLSPTGTDFGSVPTGQSPITKTITVTNTGDTQWLFGAATVPSTSAFSVAGGTCEDLEVIEQGSSCTVTVGFAPQVIGGALDSLTLYSSTGTQNIPLSGAGIAPDPQLGLSGDFDFGSVVQGYTGKQTVTLTNTGNVVLNERWTYTVDQNNSDAGDISLDNASTCGGDLTIPALAPGQSCNLILDFNANRVGSLSATMLFSGTAAAQTPLRANTAAEQRTISVSPSPLSFGPLPVNQHAVKQVSITNTGNVNWRLSGISSDWTNLNVSGTTCAAGIAPGDSCTLTVDYYPTRPGEDDHALQLQDDHGTLTPVPVTGSGVVQGITLSATALAFGQRDVGTTSARTITVTNQGNVDWAPSAVTSTGPVAVDQTAPGSCLDLQPVAPAQSCTLTVRYTPGVAGEADGSIVLSSSTPDVTIPVTGFGLVHSVTASPTTVDFGTQLIDSSTAKTVTLTNTGNSALVVTGAGSSSVDLNLTGGSCVSGPTAPGQSCSLNLQFTPGHFGSDNATLTLATTAGPVSIATSGAGTAVVRAATVTPSSLDFGSQVVGAPAVTKPVTITNTGNVDWVWTSAQSTTTELNLAGGSCFTPPVAPGASCTLNVTFVPRATGARTGTITLVSSSGMVTLTAKSTGVAAVRKISLSPQELYFGTVVAGSTTTRTLTVTNTGNLGWTFTSATIKGAAAVRIVGGSCSPSAPVAPGASCTISLRYQPTGAQLLLADLSVLGSAGTSHAWLAGIGLPQLRAVSYSATTLAFGHQAVGSHTGKTITIRNVGNVNWVPGSLQVPAGQPFSITSSSCTAAALAPGHSCTITVGYAPAQRGTYATALTVIASFGGARISLTGTA